MGWLPSSTTLGTVDEGDGHPGSSPRHRGRMSDGDEGLPGRQGR